MRVVWCRKRSCVSRTGIRTVVTLLFFCRPLPSAAPRRWGAYDEARAFGLAVDQKRVEGTSGNPYDPGVTRAACRHGRVELDQYPELDPAHATTNIAMANGAASAIRPAPMRSVILPIVGSFPAVGADGVLREVWKLYEKEGLSTPACRRTRRDGGMPPSPHPVGPGSRAPLPGMCHGSGAPPCWIWGARGGGFRLIRSGALLAPVSAFRSRRS